ncbi:hypothetical protein [Cytophaga aurantiaca]|uniref:hypothetical protein n=1 Tax=Cytophaga aurantiaca TaxID=29530 RepID=UPI00037F8282|nr:hypothetical protein [Cytophaga aurantiaca]
MLKLKKEIKDKISYGIIGAIIFTALLPILGSRDGLVIFFQHGFILSLAVFYTIISEKKDLFFLTFILFIVQRLTLIGFSINISNEVFYMFIKIFSVVAILSNVFPALALWIEAKHNKESGNMELAEILLIVLFLIPLCLEVLYSVNVIIPDFSMGWYLAFGFLIILLMRKRNLWLQYSENKKNILMFILVVCFVELIKKCSMLI